MHNEIAGWINDNINNLNREITSQILQELRLVKLKPGLCIACKNTHVADDTPIKIVKILEENRVDKEIIKEFEKDFCMG